MYEKKWIIKIQFMHSIKFKLSFNNFKTKEQGRLVLIKWIITQLNHNIKNNLLKTLKKLTNEDKINRSWQKMFSTKLSQIMVSNK